MPFPHILEAHKKGNHPLLPVEQEGYPGQTPFGRQAVLEACLKTTLAISAAGVGLRLAAQPIARNVPLLDSNAVRALLTSKAQFGPPDVDISNL